MKVENAKIEVEVSKTLTIDKVDILHLAQGSIPAAIICVKEVKNRVKFNYETDAAIIFNFLCQHIPGGTYDILYKLMEEHKEDVIL